MKSIYGVVGIVVIMVVMIALLTSMNVRAGMMDDSSIESSARESYVFKTYLKGDDIKIQSKDGIVTLTGIVSEESRKGLAKETVAGLPGVKIVENRLEVKGASPTANSDEWIGEKVKATLGFHGNVSSNTEVKVKDGIVTLHGEASSQAQKDLTTEYAKDIEGVKDVENKMTIPKTSKMLSKKVIEGIDDASITALVKMSLLYHRSTSALNTNVKTNEGVVMLQGEAKNAAEKDLVTKFVKNINGVKVVDNQMTIEK